MCLLCAGFRGRKRLREWEKNETNLYIFAISFVLYSTFLCLCIEKGKKTKRASNSIEFSRVSQKKLKEREKRKMRKKKFLQNLGIVRTSIIQSMHRNLNNFKLSIDLIKRTFLSLYDHPGDLTEDFLKSRALRLQSIAPLTIRSRRRETLVNVINVFVFW